MNYEKMSMDELKEVAKKYDIKIGNIGKDKLIEKIVTAQSTDNVLSGETDDFTEEKAEEKTVVEEKASGLSVVNSIMESIDDLDEANGNYEEEDIVDLPDSAVIPVRSFTFGELIYKSPQNNSTFIWNNIGDVLNMTVAQITEMNNSNESFLKKPRVILADEKAMKHFRLTKVYEDVAKINNLKELFKKDLVTISEVIDEILAVNMRDVLVSKVRTMYEKKSLTDIRIIRLLSEKLKFDFADIG